jgi:Pretoxin HINT domain/ribonuclease
MARKVTAVHVDSDLAVADVVVRDRRGRRSVVHTTPNHPFWDVTARAWVRADGLAAGDRPSTLHGRGAAVVSTTSMDTTADRYNLTVQRDHTYYVVAGATPVLVHNTGPLCGAHGGVSGSPGGPGLVAGPAPSKAFGMLQKVKSRTGGIGKVPGYAGNQNWANRLGQLPDGAYREWDVNALAELPACSVCEGPIRGGERLLTPRSGSGSAYYTPDHYETFYHVGEYP